MGYLLGVWFFEPWMITFGLLFPFIGNMILLTVTGGWNKDPEDEEEEVEEEAKEVKSEVGISYYLKYIYFLTKGRREEKPEGENGSYARNCTYDSGEKIMEIYVWGNILSPKKNTGYD